jgi:hypothetical protein
MRVRPFQRIIATLTLAAAAIGPFAAPALAAYGPPDLEVDISATPNPVPAVGALTYTLHVYNTVVEKCTPGWPEPKCVSYGQSVSGVAAAFTLPAGTRYQSGTGDHAFVCPSSVVSSTVLCTGGILAAGDMATITIRVTAPANAGSTTAVATVDPNNTIAERSETNNTFSLGVTVRPAGPRAYTTRSSWT